MKTKSLEQLLTESRNKFQTVFDGITERFILIDSEYKILAVNRFTQQLIGQDFAEINGRYCYEILSCTLNKSKNCAAKKAFETGEVSRISYSDDLGIYLDIHAFPLKDKRGRTVQVIEHTRDISEVKRLQDQLLQSEKMGAIGSLAAGIAHELRNPLAIMASAAQFCLTQIDSPKMLMEHLNIIIRNAQAANRVIKELLDFARPSQPRFEMGSISEVIHTACSLIKSRTLKQNVKLTVNCPPDLPQMRLDQEHLQEALVNFLVNSLDAMKDGGRLTVTTSHLPQDRFVTISIMDTGCGVPEKHIPQLFDPFFTTKKGGIGLGMSVSRRVIESHGGTVDLESTPGKQTTVTIKLPIVPVIKRYRMQK